MLLVMEVSEYLLCTLTQQRYYFNFTKDSIFYGEEIFIIVEKQLPLQVSQNWLKVRPPIKIGLCH